MMREKVLQILFPKVEQMDEEAGASPGATAPFPSQEEERETGRASTSIVSIDSHKYMSSVRACAICLEEIGHQHIVSGLSCDHIFHHDCLMQWMLQDHQDCPICRRALWDPEIFHQIEEELQRCEKCADKSKGASQLVVAVQVVPGSADGMPRYRIGTRSPSSNSLHNCRGQRAGGWKCIFGASLILAFVLASLFVANIFGI